MPFRFSSGATSECTWVLPDPKQPRQDARQNHQQQWEEHHVDLAVAVATAMQRKCFSDGKRAKALKAFTSLLQADGLRILKHHKRGGAGVRLLKYDPSHALLEWDSHRLFFKTKKKIPVRDILDVELEAQIVWIKTLHMGEFGLELEREVRLTIPTVDSARLLALHAQQPCQICALSVFHQGT